METYRVNEWLIFGSVSISTISFFKDFIYFHISPVNVQGDYSVDDFSNGSLKISF